MDDAFPYNNIIFNQYQLQMKKQPIGDFGSTKNMKIIVILEIKWTSFDEMTSSKN